MFGVLSSAELAKSISTIMKKRTHKNVLNKRGSKTDPWGTPNKVSSLSVACLIYSGSLFAI